jgi:hypothetical protein
LYARHQAGDERGPVGQGGNLHVFVLRVGAVADGAKPV